MAETRSTHFNAGKSSCPTLVSTILDTAQLNTSNNKSESWFKDLSCLRMNAGDPNAL
jgi:hypothetical protein